MRVFVRVKRSGSTTAPREYLQIVESVRDGQAVRQRVLATLGRRDQIVADGTLDGLLQSLAKFSQRLRVVEKVRADGLQAHTARSWGPALVFERLWREQGLPELLGRLSQRRQFGFDVERAAFALALQRLCAPGSDLAGSAWLRTVECDGFERLQLQHLYRTVAFLAESRDLLEKDLFLRDRDLFSQTLDLVFIDTTSTYLYGTDQTPLRRRGFSRDRKPDEPQVIICLAVDRYGWPIAWDVLPGNTVDTRSFVAMIKKLRERFHIGRVAVVADRGMLSRETLALLTDGDAPFDYVLGCRMRQQGEVTEEVLARAGRYHKIADNREVKEVVVDGRRYVVCRNPVEARKDAAARQALLAKLAAKLAHGPKAVVGNKGFSRFVKGARGAMKIDRAAIERDARLDGKFVLRTSLASLSPEQIAQTYKSLWRVERAFRETKSTLEVRPVYHHTDGAVIGHIVGCFLALRLEVDLQRRLDERGVDASWPDVMRDLGELRAVDLSLDGERYRLRTDLVGLASKALAAAGVRAPSVVTHLGPAPPPHPSDSDNNLDM